VDTIDVRDLPEPMAQAVAETVENLRKQVRRPKNQRPGELPVWRLGVREPLNREAIYDHLDRDL